MDEVTITAEDLDPVIAEARRLGYKSVYSFFGRGQLKLSQIRAAFRMAYGNDVEQKFNFEYHEAVGDKQCQKCLGTGVFATMIVDGRPYSPTGTTCWKCNGSGWISRKVRVLK